MDTGELIAGPALITGKGRWTTSGGNVYRLRKKDKGHTGSLLVLSPGDTETKIPEKAFNNAGLPERRGLLSVLT